MDKPPSTDAAPADMLTRALLAIRRIGIDTYRENVAYLHRYCPLYRAEGFQALSKISVHANGRRILATRNVVDDPSIVGCEELGLSEDACAKIAEQFLLWHQHFVGCSASIDAAVTHALFIPQEMELMRASGIREVWSTDCVTHATNAVSMAELLVGALRSLQLQAPGR